MSAPTSDAEALAAVKRKSALIGQYLTDEEIAGIITDNNTVVDGVTTYDVECSAIACLQYARGLVPTQKTIGNISLAYESIDKSIADLAGPGGNVALTRPYGDNDNEVLDGVVTP